MDGGRLAKQLAPVIDRAVRCQERGRAFRAPMTNSSKSSAAVCESFRMPKSSMISSGAQSRVPRDRCA